MTIITYKDGIMAADSMYQRGPMPYRSIKKIIETDDLVIGGAGDADDRALMEILRPIKDPSELPTVAKLRELEADSQHLVIFRKLGKVYLIGSDEDGKRGWVVELKEKYYAIGSGEKVALGAMYMGSSAKEAVEAAIKHIDSCGPPVQVVEI